MATPFRHQTRNDPLCGFFRWGSKLFPITNSHICIVQGEIDRERLRRALLQVVPRFEQLRDLRAAPEAEADLLVQAVTTRHPVAFDNENFRRELMALVAAAEPGGLVRHPVRLLLLKAEDGSRTCLHLGISHDVADVKSGNIVLAALMQEYEKGVGSAEAALPMTHRHHALESIRPGWYKGAAGLLRRGRAHLEITRRMSARERTQVRFTARGHAVPEEEQAGNDFHHLILPVDLQEAIHAAAGHYGVTLNTLFSAALVRYIGKHQEPQSPRAVYTIAVSLRRLLGDAYREAFRSFMVDCTLRVPHDVGTRELLAAVDAEMAAIRNGRLELELGRMENAISLFRNPLPKSLVYWIMKRTQGTNVLYSNPGVVDEDFAEFGKPGAPILETAIFGCLVHPYDLMFLTPTVNGRLQLDVVYRRACFPEVERQFVEPFLAELERLLQTETGPKCRVGRQ